MCFEIWKTRNRFIFDDKASPPPHFVLKSVVLLAKEFIATQNLNVPTPIAARECEKFPSTWIHVKIDASFVDIETKICIAGVILDKQGQ